MSDVSAKLQEYNLAVEQEELATQRVMDVLIELKTAAGGSTFAVGGQYYQVRNRKGKTYLCELSGPPKGRPKKVIVPEEEAAPEATPEAPPAVSPKNNVDSAEE